MTSTGTPTNVIHGFLSMINKVVNDYDPKQIIITWDLPGKTFRNDIYKEYKANRSPAPDNFNVQIPLLHELIESFNIPQVSVEGHEADDVLGSLSNVFNQNNENVLTDCEFDVNKGDTVQINTPGGGGYGNPSM